MQPPIALAGGTWSLYFNQTAHHDGRAAVDKRMVLEFLPENPPVLAITKSHTGNFRQGDVGVTYTITVTNNGPGPTGGHGGR